MTEAAADALFALGKLVYETGRYAVASRLLSYYKRLVAGDSDAERGLKAQWGILAADVMLQQWDAAADRINDLSTGIEKVRDGVSRMGERMGDWWGVCGGCGSGHLG